jgi:hypothetical protein
VVTNIRIGRFCAINTTAQVFFSFCFKSISTPWYYFNAYSVLSPHMIKNNGKEILVQIIIEKKNYISY